MDGRKVLSRYYPPDFDPQKLKDAARGLHRKGAQQHAPKFMEVRFMWPFTFQCTTCNEFNYVGTKINSRIQKSKTEHYLELPIWFFYNRCGTCRGEVVFKTDPKHTDYVMVSGGKRFYTPEPMEEIKEGSDQSDDFEDPMKSLETKTSTTAEAMAELEALDSLRTINKRTLHRDMACDAALEKRRREADEKKSEVNESEMQVQESLQRIRDNVDAKMKPVSTTDHIKSLVKEAKNIKKKKTKIIIDTDLSKPLVFKSKFIKEEVEAKLQTKKESSDTDIIIQQI